ncbi:MAG: radical SAM protein [Clostridiales bacterium]|nr:radical SAM protein [Clostridiales bacterium]MDY6116387.1 radical SAM protein [Anaerovoracaceae bacterium]
MSIKDRVTIAMVDQALNYLDKDPHENLPKLLNMVEKFDLNHALSKQIKNVREGLDGENDNWRKLVDSIYQDVDSEIIKTLFKNAVLNSVVLSRSLKEEVKSKYDCNVPWAILLDPTSACNLSCTGCWASEYGNKLNLSFDEIDSIITQGKEIGIFMYIYTGGEPLVRKNDIIELCKKHNDCVFLAFTNATLIDEEFAKQIREVKNFVPAISIEGDKEATDSRRGDGTYDKVVHAMEILRRYKVPFGASTCYTSANYESITDDEYFDRLISFGAKFAWFFHYMPIGNDAVPELLLNPDQRETVYRKIRDVRNRKSIFLIDFQNDGEYIGGCIAGGRDYFHINPNGDVEPCVFIHYSDSNIREKTLIECLTSPLFTAYKEGQPFNCNHLMPCPMLENPEKLRDIVHATGAHSTDLISEESVDNLCAKCSSYSEEWRPRAEEIWAEKAGK